MTPEEFIDFLNEWSDPMKKFSNDISDKPTRTDDERASEIFTKILTLNEDLEPKDKMSFSYCPRLQYIMVSTFEASNYKLYDTTYKSEELYSGLLKFISDWYGEKMANYTEKLYDELTRNADASTPT